MKLANASTDCCPAPVSGLNVSAAERLAPVFKALGDPVRLRHLGLLLTLPGRPDAVA
ncbi:hypothetical protein [Micropruina sp.]|uniref:hypothetical protein n=1 Tax=Micropruina sp. TaxID=2737536 RepID=UPI0039E6AA8E